MSIEKRKSRRSDINVIIAIKELGSRNGTITTERQITVNATNVSMDGMAFKTDEQLTLNTYYNSTIKLANGLSFEIVIEIIRMENIGEPETTYGCRFVAIDPETQFKIVAYQIVDENAH